MEDEDRVVYSLNYLFDFHEIDELKPGDSIPSSCPPTHQIADPSDLDWPAQSDAITGVLNSKLGFPLTFSLQLIYRHLGSDHKHRFLLKLRLHQPRHIPFLPPLLIQPTLRMGADQRPLQRHQRQIGPGQPASWKYTGPGFPNPRNIAGQFQFVLLNEPLRLLANLPPLSRAHWSCLPVEMVTEIMRQLPFTDRVRARLVCRAWARVLDTHSRAWSNVTHIHSIPNFEEKEGRYSGHGGRLAQVRACELDRSLEFLTARKAPIQAFEISHCPTELLTRYKDLQFKLKSFGIRLKHISFRNVGKLVWLRPAEKEVLVKLLRSQSSLQSLHLEVDFSSLLPLLSPSLRILSLRLKKAAQLNILRINRTILDILNGLSIQCDLESDAIDNFSVFLMDTKLRRVMSVEQAKGYVNCCCSGEGDYRLREFVWGTENLCPETAVSLLLPRQLGCWHQVFSRHV